MHPLIPFTPPPAPGLAGKRVLITAGRRDPIASVAGTEALAGYFEAQGVAVRLHWHDGGHELRQEEFAAAATLLQSAQAA
jgi:phospholipase/carboxylesterase